MNSQTYNNLNPMPEETRLEIEAFLAEEEKQEIVHVDEPYDKDRASLRRRRKDDRKAKKHQLALAASVKSKHKSKYRWNPLWHKMKLSDISPKKIKSRSNDSFI